MDGFVAKTEALLSHLATPPAASPLYRFLSQAVTKGTVVKDAYAIALLPSALAAEDAVAADDHEARAYRWVYEASYSVTGGAGMDLDVNVEVGGTNLGSVHLSVVMDKKGRVSVSPAWAAPDPAVEADRTACSQFLRNPFQLKIYYDSGHAVAKWAVLPSGLDRPAVRLDI